MSTTQRIYLVTKRGGNKRLVKAINQAQAYRHVARTDFDVTAANKIEIADMMQAGVKVEEANADPEPTNDPEPTT